MCASPLGGRCRPPAAVRSPAQARFDLSGVPSKESRRAFRRAINADILVRSRVGGFMGAENQASPQGFIGTPEWAEWRPAGAANPALYFLIEQVS